MRVFAMLFLSLFLSKSCEGQTKSDLKKAVIEYTANTRGFYQKITIQNQKASISKDREGVEKPQEIAISKTDWDILTQNFKAINLDSLATLKAPTKKRQYDGAAAANLKINYKNKEYQTPSFDHGYPPVMIKKLVLKINSFARK